MHQSEWLDEAKKVPVGQHRRVYHGAERRTSLVVWNNEDSWSAYCHACGTGGKVWKKSLQRVEVEAPVYRKYLNLKQCVTLPVLAQHYPSKCLRLSYSVISHCIILRMIVSFLGSMVYTWAEIVQIVAMLSGCTTTTITLLGSCTCNPKTHIVHESLLL